MAVCIATLTARLVRSMGPFVYGMVNLALRRLQAWRQAHEGSVLAQRDAGVQFARLLRDRLLVADYRGNSISTTWGDILSVMTPKLHKRLEKIEAAVQETKPILAPLVFETTMRTNLAVAILSQIYEHHESMLLLITAEKTGSAFTLVRSIVEGSYRGIWLDACATNAEVDRFVKKDKIDLTMEQIAKSVDATCLPVVPGEPELNQFFHRVKVASWSGLNSFTHTGMLQLDRRFTNGQLQAKYSEEDIFNTASLATTMILLFIMNFLARREQFAARDAVEAFLMTYGPVEEAGLDTVLKSYEAATGSR